MYERACFENLRGEADEDSKCGCIKEDFLKREKEKSEREERKGGLCCAPVKVSDSWMIVYYCK